MLPALSKELLKFSLKTSLAYTGSPKLLSKIQIGFALASFGGDAISMVNKEIRCRFTVEIGFTTSTVIVVVRNERSSLLLEAISAQKAFQAESGWHLVEVGGCEYCVEKVGQQKRSRYLYARSEGLYKKEVTRSDEANNRRRSDIIRGGGDETIV
jgi:hypothetical protein